MAHRDFVNLTANSTMRKIISHNDNKKKIKDEVLIFFSFFFFV